LSGGLKEGRALVDGNLLTIRLEDYTEMLHRHLRASGAAGLWTASGLRTGRTVRRGTACQPLILCLIFQRVRRFLLPIFLLRLGLAMSTPTKG
jgi:hypothetical protein